MSGGRGADHIEQVEGSRVRVGQSDVYYDVRFLGGGYRLVLDRNSNAVLGEERGGANMDFVR
jgi:hypothetical protein